MRFGEAESLATPMWEERDTTVRAVAGHLASLWERSRRCDDDGDPLVTEKGLPHARASVLNLIVTVVDDGAADRVVRHAASGSACGTRRARSSSCREPAPAERSLDARISTHCHDAQPAAASGCATRRWS